MRNYLAMWRLGLCSLALSVACGGNSDPAPNGPNGGRGGGTSGNGFGGRSAGSGGSQPVGFDGTPGDTGFVPLKPGCGPETAKSCTNTCETGAGTTTTVIRPPATLCFTSEEDPTPADPIAIIEQVIEEINGRRVVHLRVTFDPHFVDNTYGANAVGWNRGQTGSGGATATGSGGAANQDPMMGGGKKPDMKMGMAKSGHTFSDLVGSDHVELLLTDGSSATVMDIKVDYITASSAESCGYDNLGVTGGEGKVITGSASAIIASTSSLDRNLNHCGYCLTEDSPATDEYFTPNPATPKWDYRMVYEVWIDEAAFGSSGFGQAYITFVHASPSKLANNTVTVVPGQCPPTWDTPYCPEGQTGPGCENSGTCPPNQQLYVQTEGRSICTPIPFSGYPNMAPCPQGYVLDAATEGRYCVPAQ